MNMSAVVKKLAASAARATRPTPAASQERAKTNTTIIAAAAAHLAGEAVGRQPMPRPVPITFTRCHVGHQFGPQSLAAAQVEGAEAKLWSAVATLEEAAAAPSSWPATPILATMPLASKAGPPTGSP